ncbi:uncharacterized protein LOC131073587 [Cryptomeria japonica]|uniref:uncharacterized protein LOC131073587 n=1 Tax=Cryptomeria japonica TaxID=3369 RepID=UPI0027DA471D|nr:uncharacterized protein LOC131073587 [Cryptomeria japonica]
MDLSEDLRNYLEDFEVVENENKDLKENIQLANECIEKLREQIRKFKIRHKEVSEELKQENATILDMKVKSEDNEKTKEYFKKMVKCKLEECEKLKQEVTSLKADVEKARKQESELDSNNYNKMIDVKKPLKNKKDARIEFDKCS